jgi:hypothetical protein
VCYSIFFQKNIHSFFFFTLNIHLSFEIDLKRYWGSKEVVRIGLVAMVDLVVVISGFTHSHCYWHVGPCSTSIKYVFLANQEPLPFLFFPTLVVCHSDTWGKRTTHFKFRPFLLFSIGSTPSLSLFFPFLQVASGMKMGVKAIWFMFNERWSWWLGLLVTGSLKMMKKEELLLCEREKSRGRWCCY